MATNRFNIGSKFQNTDIPSESDFKEIFDSFVHKDEDKADFQMVETGTDNEHYITPALLNVGLQNIGIITGNSYMPKKEYFDISLTGATTVSLEEFPIPNSVRVYKNGQLLQEGEGENLDYDYTVNYNTAIITFSGIVSDRNIEVDYWFKNLSPNPGSGGGGTGGPIDFSGFLHTTGNETKSGILTFNNTTPSSTSGIVLTNSGDGAASKALDITVSGSGSGISLQNSSTGKGVYLNSTAEATGDILQVAKNNVVKVKIEDDGIVTAPKFVTAGGTEFKFVKGDGSLDPTVYAEDLKALHTTGEESKDGALTLTNSLPQDVLTIEKSNDANCLKLVQNSNSEATTSTWDTSTANTGRKAISILKLGDEYASITHDGDVTARSFSTTKANLTDDGLFSLENRPSPQSSEGKAKLYAKTDGTDTHMYVMGSDGAEKKIGGEVDLSGKENTILPGTTAQYYRGDKSWQTLDKTTVGLGNVDNTSDLNKPVSTAAQTALETKQATLVSGTNIKTVNGLSILGSGDVSVAIDSNVMHLTGDVNESANGRKTFSAGINIQNSIQMMSGSQIMYSQNISSQSATGVFTYRVNDKFALKSSILTSKTSALFDTNLLDTSDKTFTFPNKSGTVALLSDIPSSSGLTISSDSFFAIITNVSNTIISSYPIKSSWTRIGNIVTVTAHLEFKFVSGNIYSQIDINFPFNATNTFQQLNIGVANLSSADGFYITGIIQKDSSTKARVYMKPRTDEVLNTYSGTAIFSYEAVPLT